MNKEFPTKYVLELACAAQRVNGTYQKEFVVPVYSDQTSDGKIQLLFHKHGNKLLMMYTADCTSWTADPKDAPMPLKITAEDVALAEEIQKYYKRLMFAAISGENDFLTNINSILTNDTVKSNLFGYVACLPSVYVRDLAQGKVQKAARQVDEGYLANIDSWIKDLDAEIISSVKSKNFEGFNIDAIINNKMASWISKFDLKLGPAVIVKAKVKGYSKHWKHQNDVTRLNYVKAAQ